MGKQILEMDSLLRTFLDKAFIQKTDAIRILGDRLVKVETLLSDQTTLQSRFGEALELVKERLLRLERIHTDTGPSSMLS